MLNSRSRFGSSTSRPKTASSSLFSRRETSSLLISKNHNLAYTYSGFDGDLATRRALVGPCAGASQSIPRSVQLEHGLCRSQRRFFSRQALHESGARPQRCIIVMTKEVTQCPETAGMRTAGGFLILAINSAEHCRGISDTPRPIVPKWQDPTAAASYKYDSHHQYLVSDINSSSFSKTTMPSVKKVSIVPFYLLHVAND